MEFAAQVQEIITSVTVFKDLNLFTWPIGPVPLRSYSVQRIQSHPRHSVWGGWFTVSRATRQIGLNYGVGSAYDPPKISELPKVAGQSCCGAGFVGTAVPFCTATWAAARHASMAGQSAALRVSFQTAAP
jgi:hypothetical protein